MSVRIAGPLQGRLPQVPSAPRTGPRLSGSSSVTASGKGAGHWLSQGACRSVDPEIFFGLPRGDKPTVQERAAMRICAECPVLAACRAWALANPDLTEFGVVGGLTERDRGLTKRREARLRQKAAAEAS